MKKLIKFKNRHKTKIYLILIISLAFYFRTFNINWDQNFYFHPDERAIAMFTIPIELPKSYLEFLSPESPLNPKFFAYGNMPLYLLKIVSEISANFNPNLSFYGGIHLVGRIISAIFDTSTVILIFLLAAKVFSKRTGLFAALLYSLSVLPIQTSHFYAVDTLLTFFLMLCLYLLLLFYNKRSLKLAIFIGITLGLAVSTKVSALIIILTIIFVFFLIFISKKEHLLKLSIYSLLILASLAITFIFTQPYALIDFKEFYTQTKLHTQMSKDPFIFPYTLQYVGKIPYFYELKNIFLWGQGPLIASISFLGVFLNILSVIKKQKIDTLNLLILFYLLSYFMVFGRFAVGWMRYMLPIYPLLAIFGGFLISDILINMLPKKYLKNYFFKKGLLVSFILVILIYPISFLSIYTKPNTRITATDWINKNIPSGSKLATEHWDDGLPTYGMEKYQITQLPLYDTDTDQKWITINQTLNSTDYIIIASNRLYAPLQKLTDCKNLPPEKCYVQTSQYYKDLFSENLGFKKAAEFTSYPTIPLFNIPINDQSADESFTVYDHPKIIIYEKINKK